MSRFTRFAAAAVLFAGLAPFAAQARPSGAPSTQTEVLVAIPGASASQAHGRAADRTPPTAGYTLAAAPQYAFSGDDDGYAG